MSAPCLSWRFFAASMVLVGSLLPTDAQALPGRGWCNSELTSPTAHCRGAAPRIRNKVPTRPLATRPQPRARRRRPALADYTPDPISRLVSIG